AAYPALLLSFAVPAGPGYLGNLEVAGALVLGGGLGLSAGVAAGTIVLYHAITAANALTLGLLSLLLVGGRRSASKNGTRKIAVFHCGFTYSGGGERLVIEEVLGLRRRGYEVECYAPTVDASRCYPDLLGEVRVKTFLPQLPRWVPFCEAVQMLVNGSYIGDIIRKTYHRDAIDCPAGCHVATSGFPLPVESRFAGGLTINGYPIRRPYVLLTNRHYPQKRFDLAIGALVE